MINKKYNIEVTVLSPLAIGAGAEKDWVKGIDYVEKDGKIYLLSMKKLVENGIDPHELTSYYATKNSTGLLSKIEGKLDEVCSKVMTLPANSDNDIKSFIKNELTGKPIIPGSSLKGAVRSVILEYLLNNTKPNRLNEKDYFGDSNKGDELMRFIKFPDTEFEETALVNTKIFNLRKNDKEWLGGWKHAGNNTNGTYEPTGFNTLYESILSNQKSVCSVMLAQVELFRNIDNLIIKSLKDNISKNEKKLDEKSQKQLATDKRFLKLKETSQPLKNKLFLIHELFALINKHTRNYLQKEIEFFTNHPAPNTDKIIEFLAAIKALIPADNSFCILKMSAGSGFHSITGDWQYDDFSNTGVWSEGRNTGKRKYKSRKVAVNGDVFSLMGFVKLRSITDKEMAEIEIEKTVQKEKEEEIRKEEKIAREKALEKSRIEKENEAKYDELLDLAKQLFENKQSEDALKAIEEAKLLLPQSAKHHKLATKIETALKAKQESELREQKIQQAAQQAEAARLEANQVPLADRIANTTKIPTMLGNVKTWMKLNSIGSLSDDDIVAVHNQLQFIFSSMIERKMKDWDKIERWKAISELVGEATALKWFNEIFKKS